VPFSAEVLVARVPAVMRRTYGAEVAFTPLFLVYVAALVLAVWSRVALLIRADPDHAYARGAPHLPVRAVALYLRGVATLFFLAWMKDIVPAIVGHTTPLSLAHTRQPTNPVEVLDLSLLLPLAVLAAFWLWR